MKNVKQFLESRFHVLEVILSHPFGRDGKRETVNQYARWMMARFAADNLVILPIISNCRLIVPAKSNLSTTMFLQQIDKNLIFICHLIRPDEYMLDVGANIGLYGLVAASATKCRVIACEPVPKTFSLLRDNVRLNQLDDLVDLYQVAVGEKSGHVSMTIDLHGRNHVVEGEGTSVP